jgi:hypothetical protein
LSIDIDPNLSPTQITGSCTGTKWTGSYSIPTPSSSQSTSFQQVAFAPPCGNTASPGLSGTTITAVGGGISPSTLQTEYTGAWAYPAYFFPSDVEMAFIVKQPSTGWPMNGIILTIVLTYE